MKCRRLNFCENASICRAPNLSSKPTEYIATETLRSKGANEGIVLAKEFSSDERILQRRIRIQRQSDAIQKQDIILEEREIVESQTAKQIETSNDLLEKLVEEGEEVISNVRVANDAREIKRREEDILIREKLLKRINEEAQDSLKKYEEINSQWSVILNSKDPLDINAGLESQELKCQLVLKQKDEIIGQLKRELENADNRYVIDQQQQSQDINILIERIENQINSMSKAFRRELLLIEDTLTNERSSLLSDINKKWDNLFAQKQLDEMKGVEERRKLMKEYEQEMNRVLIQHQEEYRSKKIWLENEYEKLQLQVENVKAMCLMNVEKLDYNYAILERRQEENTIVKNQQQRRINKLQSTLNNLKKEYFELENNKRIEIEKLEEQSSKAQKNIIELQSKSNHFMLINEKQYMDIWDMNSQIADKLLKEILNVDKIIHEEMLGSDWEPPELQLLKKEDLPSYKETIKLIQQKKEKRQELDKIFNSKRDNQWPEESYLEQQLINYILHYEIFNQTGYFNQDKLNQLLPFYSSNAELTLKVNNLFEALNIQLEDEIIVNDKELPKLKKDPIEFSGSLQADNNTLEEKNLTDDNRSEINSKNVLKALKEFLEKYNKVKGIELYLNDDSLTNIADKKTVSRSISEKDMSDYWNRYREIFSPEKEKIWDALMIGLRKYHEILKDRQRLINYNDSLRKQNLELKHLMDTYSTSKTDFYSFHE